MTQQLTLEGGGTLEISLDGALVRMKARRALDESGLYKVWLYGSQGEYRLGTLIPEQKDLVLERTVSQETLIQAGCWPVTGGKCVMSFSLTDTEIKESFSPWRWDHYPFKRLKDPVLSEAAAAWGSMLIRERESGFQLAVPADPHRPFPLLPLFCLASIHFVDGNPHVVFSFLASGEPDYPVMTQET